jgi:hypothetical protein
MILDVDAYLDNCGLSLSDESERPSGFHLDDTMVLALDLCLVILIYDVILVPSISSANGCPSSMNIILVILVHVVTLL